MLWLSREPTGRVASPIRNFSLIYISSPVPFPAVMAFQSFLLYNLCRQKWHTTAAGHATCVITSVLLRLTIVPLHKGVTVYLYLLNTLQHQDIWHKCKSWPQWEFGNCSQSQHRLWCSRDDSSPPPFTQRMSFCVALCNSAGCQSICCCSLCRCQLGCLCYWAIQQSWFARVKVLCKLSRKKSREVTAHFWADFLAGVASRCV